MKYTFPALLWMALIFVSSSIPSEDFPEVSFWGWAKLIHLFYYCVLCFLVQRALYHQRKFPGLSRHSYLIGIVVATLYGATDEFHQMYTPGRHALVSDVLIDACGALIFLLGVKVFALMSPKQTRH